MRDEKIFLGKKCLVWNTCFFNVIYFNIFIERLAFIFFRFCPFLCHSFSLSLSNLNRFVKMNPKMMFCLEKYVLKKFIFKWDLGCCWRWSEKRKRKKKSVILKYLLKSPFYVWRNRKYYHQQQRIIKYFMFALLLSVSLLMHALNFHTKWFVSDWHEASDWLINTHIPTKQTNDNILFFHDVEIKLMPVEQFRCH